MLNKGLQKYGFELLAVLVFGFICTGYIGCKKNSVKMNVENTLKDSVIKMLALGDSYTIGQSVGEGERFANQTIKLLNENGAKMQYPAAMVATTGWTTANLLSGIANALPTLQAPYDLVTLLIGVNNQYQGRDTGEYRLEFTACLQQAVAFSGNRKNRVFVLSIPDYGATPFGQTGNATQVGIEIDRFNAINKEVSMQLGIAYVDITPSSRMAVADISLVASDGLHPSGKAYAKWAAMLAPLMLPLVK